MKPISMSVRYYMAEFYGTFLIVFLGFGSFYVLDNIFIASLMVGLSVFVASSIVSHISHAHFNPLISLATVLHKRMTIKTFGIYVFGQMTGALFGVLSLLLLPINAYTPLVYESSVSVLFIEMFMVFILVYTYLAVSENKDKRILLGLAVGLSYTLTLVMGNTLGFVLLNPVRFLEFILSLELSFFETGWIYLLGGLLGSVLAFGFYHYLAFENTTYQTPKKDA